MSKVGESVIRGALEALEIVQRNDISVKASIPVETDLSEPSEPDSKTPERIEIE